MNAPKNPLEAYDRIRQAEQCFLIANLDQITVNNAGKLKSSLKPSMMKHSLNKHHIAVDPPSLLTNEELIGMLFVGPENHILFDLKPFEISALVPKIRLHRVDID